MHDKKEFWENLQLRYEQKNRDLQNRQLELQHQLEAMEALMENPSGMEEYRSCACAPPSQARGGFFKSIMSMFPSYPKSGAAPTPRPRSAPPQSSKPIKDANRAASDESVICDCDPCMFEEPTTDTNKNKNTVGFEDDCDCQPCPYALSEETTLSITPYEVQTRQAPQNLSDMSLNSMDVAYMQHIQELVQQQKNLMSNIKDMEEKNKIFEAVFSRYKYTPSHPPVQPLPSSAKEAVIPKPDPSLADQKTMEELKYENFVLKHELKEMRVEIRQYIERMELPMRFKIESEQAKCRQLEIELKQAEENTLIEKAKLEQEKDKLQVKLCTCNQEMYKLREKHKILTEELKKAQDKLNVAMSDLVRQKINEADTLKKMQEMLQAHNEPTALKEECSLYEIARELSRVLKECDPCLDCKHMPDDLKSAATLLKSLTDLVDAKIRTCGSKADLVQEEEQEAAKPKEEAAPIEPPPAPIESQPPPSAEEPMPPAEPAPPEVGKEEVIEVVVNEPPEFEAESAPPPPEPVTLLDVEPIPRMSEDSEPVEPPPSPATSYEKRKCGCLKAVQMESLVEHPIEKLWPPSREKLKINQQIVTTMSKDGLKSSNSLKCVKYDRDFPFNVETVIDYIDKKPDGVHVTTSITNSGTLEVITEGPEGVIETVLVYTESGHVEVLTNMIDSEGNKQTTTRGKYKALLPPSKSLPISTSSCKPPLQTSEYTENTLHNQPTGVVCDNPEEHPPKCLCKWSHDQI